MLPVNFFKIINGAKWDRTRLPLIQNQRAIPINLIAFV